MRIEITGQEYGHTDTIGKLVAVKMDDNGRVIIDFTYWSDGRHGSRPFRDPNGYDVGLYLDDKWLTEQQARGLLLNGYWQPPIDAHHVRRSGGTPGSIQDRFVPGAVQMIKRGNW